MKAHPIDTHLLVPRSRSSAKVKVKYQGHVSQKMGVSGALVFHKHILFFIKNHMMTCMEKWITQTNKTCFCGIDLNQVYLVVHKSDRKTMRS